MKTLCEPPIPVAAIANPCETLVERQEPPDSVSEAPLTTGAILAVDDDEAALDGLKDLLEISGFKVMTAREGQEGIRTVRDNKIDLVITDIRMPHMDGLELLRRIREIDDTIPVILVTGHGDLENALRALRRGAYDFLLKPINLEILLNTITKGLEHCRLKRFENRYRLVLEEQVRARTKALEEANDFLQGIMDSSTKVSIVLTDFNRKVVFWNSGAENIFGYTAEEMIGSSITRLYPNDDPMDDSMEGLRRMIASKWDTVQAYVKQRAKDGRLLTISLTISAMRDSSDRIRGILGMGQDVTEQVRLHEELLRSYRRIRRMQGASIFALARIAEARDGETAHHLNRIQEYCRVLCGRLRTDGPYSELLDDQFVEDLVQVSVLHDIGKISMPDEILFNPNKFEDIEFEKMKTHTSTGSKALLDAANDAGQKESYLLLAADIAHYHHEKWDGTGYPKGLKGEAIPLSARIVAVADVYDAITTTRRYKPAFSHEHAKLLIAAEKGAHFDPVLVDAFLECEQDFERIKKQFSGATLDLSGNEDSEGLGSIQEG